MRKAGAGAIVNIASASPSPVCRDFSIRRFQMAVRGMTRLAARDLAEFRIRSSP